MLSHLLELTQKKTYNENKFVDLPHDWNYEGSL